MRPFITEFRNFLARWFGYNVVPIDQTAEIPLYPATSINPKKKSKEKVRFAKGHLRVVSNIHTPSIMPFIPAKNTLGAAVIIAPGGGHSALWIDHEGYLPAQWLCEHGVAAFVLKYRLAMDVSSSYKVHEHALADIQRAIRMIRNQSAQWGIKKNLIGVMGFSAGGELAGLAAIHGGDIHEYPADAIDRESARPDFQALVYPADTSSFRVSKNFPPIFLLAGAKDFEIANEISVLYKKYQESGVHAELHIYEDAGHGFGVQKSNRGEMAKWPEQFLSWLSKRAD